MAVRPIGAEIELTRPAMGVRRDSVAAVVRRFVRKKPLGAAGGVLVLIMVVTAIFREMQYVEAARALGLRHLRIAFRHVLPNTIGPFIVLVTAQLGAAILVEAALSFLGLGVPEPYPSWGRMLSVSAAEYAQKAPHLVLLPGIAISLAVFGSNLLGDALRDVLDPRLRGA